MIIVSSNIKSSETPQKSTNVKSVKQSCHPWDCPYNFFKIYIHQVAFTNIIGMYQKCDANDDYISI